MVSVIVLALPVTSLNPCLNRRNRHNPRHASHDFLVLLGHLQVVGGLQAHPQFRRASE
jgi:hypothetical protein